jgi:hypothetical protein
MSIIGNAVTVGSGGGEPELLWTNTAAVTASFPSQTVSLPAGYSAYLVEFRLHRNYPQILGTLYVPFGGSRYTAALSGYTYPDNNARRQITSVSDGSIAFGTSTNSNNDYIPTRIWGVKWTI